MSSFIRFVICLSLIEESEAIIVAQIQYNFLPYHTLCSLLSWHWKIITLCAHFYVDLEKNRIGASGLLLDIERQLFHWVTGRLNARIFEFCFIFPRSALRHVFSWRFNSRMKVRCRPRACHVLNQISSLEWRRRGHLGRYYISESWCCNKCVLKLKLILPLLNDAWAPQIGQHTNVQVKL